MAFVVDNKRIAKNTIALYVRTIVTMIISFFSARVTLQVLGVDDYGLNNLVGSIVALFSFLNASMGTAVQRFFNIEIGKGNEGRLGRIYGVGVYLHIIVAVITVVIAEVFAIFFLGKMNIPTERLFAAHVVFQISIFSMALSIVNVPNYALLKARELFDKMAIVEIVQAFLRLAVLYCLYIISYDKLILLSVLNLGVTLYYVASIFFMARKFPESHNKPCRDRGLVKEMIKFISLLIITVLAELGRNQGLVMLINIFFGLAINAAYAIALQVSNMISSFVVNIKQPIVPQMMAAYGAEDKEAMFKLINYGTKITALLMIVLTLPVIFEIDFILELWLKTPPDYTSNLVILVLININISSFTYFLYQGVHATGRIVLQQVYTSALFVLNIVLIFICFKLGYNFYYALYVTIFISFSQCMVNILMAKKFFQFDIFAFIKDSVLPYCLFCLISSSFFYLFTHIFEPSLIRAILVIVIGSVVTVLLGYAILLNTTEKKRSLEFARNLILSHKNK